MGRSPQTLIKVMVLAWAAVLVLTGAVVAQPIPGSEGWLLTPMQGQVPAPQKISQLDAALIRCYRTAIATGQFFLGDATYVLGRCQRPFDAWVHGCEHREGQGAAICLLGPEQAVGESLHDAWSHRDNLQGWLASLPPLPKSRSGQN